MNWFSLIVLVDALGLMLAGIAFSAARDSAPFASGLFWASLLTLFVPTCLRLLMPSTARGERIGLLVALGLGLYLVKVLHSPTAFTFADELMHWRTLDDIVRSGRLFQENPLLPVATFYPALEIVTAALVNLSGMSYYAAGVVVLAAARIVLVLAMFLLYEQASRSSWLAGIGSLLYIANPNYLFFGAQFAYESLALPLAVLVVYAIVKRERGAPRNRFGLTIIAVLTIGAVVVAHHITSYALIAFLVLWTVAARFTRAHRRKLPGPAGMAVLAVAASAAWLLFVATRTIDYLAPQFQGALNEMLRLYSGEASTRPLFVSSSGSAAPFGEQITGFAAVIFILLGLPLGWFYAWQRYRHNALVLALAVGALGYPASLALRFTRVGAQISNRSSEFLFLGVGFVLALAIAMLWTLRPAHWRLPVAFTAWATVIFMGGVIIGWAGWARLPGPYMVTADTRSIEAQGVAAATWAREALGPDQRIIADRINRFLMGTYGQQRPVTNYADRLPTYNVVFAEQLGPEERDILERGGIRYVVVDRRLTTELPTLTAYFERGEPRAGRHTTPIDPAVLEKFDADPRVSKIYDSGDIKIYDVGALLDEPIQP